MKVMRREQSLEEKYVQISEANFARCCSAAPSMDRKFAEWRWRGYSLGVPWASSTPPHKWRVAKWLEVEKLCFIKWKLCSVFCELPSAEKMKMEKRSWKFVPFYPCDLSQCFLAVDNEWIVYCLTCFYTSVSVF